MGSVLSNLSINDIKKELKKPNLSELFDINNEYLNLIDIINEYDQYEEYEKYKKADLKESSKRYLNWKANIEKKILDIIKLRLKLDLISDDELLKHFKESDELGDKIYDAPNLKFKNGQDLSLTEISKVASLKYYPLDLDRLIPLESLRELSSYFLEKGLNMNLSGYNNWII